MNQPSAHNGVLHGSPRSRAVGILLGICLTGASIAHSQTTSWRGTSSSSWFDASQWSAGTPTASTKTTVSVGSPMRQDLMVPSPTAFDTASVKELTIQKGGRLTFAAGPVPGHLIVHGTALSLNGGDLILGSGRIVFRSNVQINNGGTIDAGSGTLEFQGNVTASSGSVFTPGTSTVILNGSGDQTISGSLEFNNLVVETGGVLSLSGAITVNGSVVIEEGSTLIVQSGTTFDVAGSISGGGSLINENALPVQMTALAAVPRAQSVTLQWSTASETDNHGFAIERRRVGNGTIGAEFASIGFVAGAGTSTMRREYAFADANVSPGRYVYRVTAIDRDGTRHEALEVETVVDVPSSVALLANYPNPFNPTTVVGFRLPESAPVRLSIFDIAGREVAVLIDGHHPAGEHRLTWDASGLPSGVYYSRLTTAAGSWSRPLVLTR